MAPSLSPSVQSSPSAKISRRDDRRYRPSSTRAQRERASAGEQIIPASLNPHEEPLPLTSSRLYSETDQGSRGAFLDAKKYFREVAADGSFEEHAESTSPAVHRLTQNVDGSGTAFDQIIGFGMYDVKVAPRQQETRRLSWSL